MAVRTTFQPIIGVTDTGVIDVDFSDSQGESYDTETHQQVDDPLNEQEYPVTAAILDQALFAGQKPREVSEAQMLRNLADHIDQQNGKAKPTGPFVVRYTPDAMILNDPRILEALGELIGNNHYVVIDTGENGNYRVRSLSLYNPDERAALEKTLDNAMMEWGAAPTLVRALRFVIAAHLGSSDVWTVAITENRSFDAPCDIDDPNELPDAPARGEERPAHPIG